MISNEEKVRAAIAEQAGKWLVASDEGPLDARDAAALAVWLKTSPVHVEEFLGVSTVARDLRAARADPEYALDAILARARAEDDAPGRALWARVVDAVQGGVSGRWLTAAVTMAACGVLSWVAFDVARETDRAPDGARRHYGTALRDPPWRTAESSVGG
jgi:ferric-dicitrate binding protein FerR (iron transport regulator)